MTNGDTTASGGRRPFQRVRNWPLKALIAGAVVIPLVLFAIAAIITNRETHANAERLIERNAALLREHALRVFDAAGLLVTDVHQRLAGLDDATIAREAPQLAPIFREMLAFIPQARGLIVLDASGMPVASAGVFPAFDHAAQTYFTALRDDPALGQVISRVFPAPAEGEEPFFALGEVRFRDGAFAGVTVIPFSPDAFEEVYAELFADTDLIAGLVRDDGSILAIHPFSEVDLSGVPPVESFAGVIADRPARGTHVLPPNSQGDVWRIAFDRIGTLPVYTAVALSLSSIQAAWLGTMGIVLAVALPFALVLGAVGLLALSRTRREATALALLQAETALREETEEKLRQAGKMEAVGQLSGGIAHDFNNLLTAVGGNLELLAKRIGDDQPKLARYIAAAREGVARGASLTQRLLAFSRRQALRPAAVNTNQLVSGMSDILHRTLGEQVEVEIVLGTGVWRVFADPNQLENAILNLAINGRDAMPDGGRLTIETANMHIDEGYLRREGLSDVGPGQYVLVAVSDTGTGMPAEVKERAFEPFFTTKAPGEGTGLGLSMVYGFVKQSGGHAKIYSEVGEGTTVRLYLPRMTGSEPAAAAAASVPVPDAAGRGESVLVVEDDPGVLAFETETLTAAGYRVVEARDGHEAKAALDRGETFDLVITDVVLPGGLNGRQVADLALAARPGIPVLFVTGYTRNAIVHHGRLDPGVQLLSKPFAAGELLGFVRRLLDGAAGGS